jgi:hypothetical protein
MARAKIRIRLKNWKGAIDSLGKALKAKPGDPEAKKLLAEARRHIEPERTLVLGAVGSLVTNKTGVGHRLQVWRVRPEHVSAGRYRLRIQHAAAGMAGAFWLVAWVDTTGNGVPDRELALGVPGASAGTIPLRRQRLAERCHGDLLPERRRA